MLGGGDDAVRMEVPPRASGRRSARRSVRNPVEPGRAGSEATELVLGGPERWVLQQVRRHGTTRFVALLTFFSVVASVVVVAITMVAAFDTDPEYLVPGLIMAAVTPAVVAPSALIFNVRLAVHLDTASDLLRRAALTDPLTGVLNRRGFFDALTGVRDGGREVEIAMVDVDDFKRLNDRHGHAVGDQVLCDVAEWLWALVGDTGTVARIGGDEFAFLAELDGQRRLPGRRALTTGEAAYTITIGRAVCAAGEDPEAALVRADADLYHHKGERSAGEIGLGERT